MLEAAHLWNEGSFEIKHLRKDASAGLSGGWFTLDTELFQELLIQKASPATAFQLLLFFF